ncbi:MAG: nucleotide sugar dehydrogenase [bacterium]|nr:nucleotide sugar dehydrogenase [bacterium]
MSHKIAVVGLWHLGEIYSVGLAELGHQVVGISDDEVVVANLSKNIPPLAEPGLVELLEKNQSLGRLVYSTDFSCIKDCDILWFTFDTPVDDKDEVDLSLINQALEKAMPFLRDGVLVVMTSQTPVGTAEEYKAMISTARPDIVFDYAYVPENLRLGEAMRCFFKPVRIVVGAENEKTFQLMRKLFSSLEADFLEMSLASAEMAKHTLNSFLATSLAFTYDIADICERVGADVVDVIRALKSDERIGQRAYLDANVGFSGGTLGRDIKALLRVSLHKGIDTPVISSIWEKSRNRRLIVIERLRNVLGYKLEGKKIAIFGLTYKAGTTTLRRSLSLEVARDLITVGAVLRLHDPQADIGELKSLDKFLFFSRDPYDAASSAQAVVIMTPWPEFRNLDFGKLGLALDEPHLLLDGRNFLMDQEKEISDAGIMYLGIGRS